MKRKATLIVEYETESRPPTAEAWERRLRGDLLKRVHVTVVSDESQP